MSRRAILICEVVLWCVCIYIVVRIMLDFCTVH